ncbi:MAG: aldehyde dehydrogenase family protein, partial [Acidobacteria bacterium]|nr:aldehyde dehydrogenase family protein [Acidobacteriota bacterium]MDW7983460.1 aldehyde dehydrogenase family protein [Acidobacteriota bacterium]
MNVSPFRNEPFMDFSSPENRRRMEDALRQVEAQLGREYPLIIGDKEIYTDEKLYSYNPSQKDQVVGIFQKAQPEHVDRALEAAWAAFETWRWLPPEERAAVLFRAARLARDRKFELIAWQVFEVGKNWAEADADVAET